jgi:hypothetical protein
VNCDGFGRFTPAQHAIVSSRLCKIIIPMEDIEFVPWQDVLESIVSSSPGPDTQKVSLD